MLSRNELDSILAAAEEAEQRGMAAVLATVVVVRGSSYRKPGARMLVREDGVVAGGVSGGCLEAAVIRKARFSLIAKRPSIHVYDTMDEDDMSFGASLNCRGEITILIEPLVTDRARAHLKRLRLAQDSENPVMIGLDISQTGDVAATAGIVPLDSSTGVHSTSYPDVASVADEVFSTQRYGYWRSENGRELFFESLPPAHHIVLFGAGPEAVSLAMLAHTLGCPVTIIDERPGYLSRHAFPAGVRIRTTTTEQLGAELKLDGRSACVIATHNSSYDQRALRLVLSHPACPYIGLLGPRGRGIELVERFGSSGHLRPGDVERLYSPVGLDVGAETPEQIALAIIAEIHAVFASRTGGSLRDRSRLLHSETLSRGQEVLRV